MQNCPLGDSCPCSARCPLGYLTDESYERVKHHPQITAWTGKPEPVSVLPRCPDNTSDPMLCTDKDCELHTKAKWKPPTRLPDPPAKRALSGRLAA